MKRLPDAEFSVMQGVWSCDIPVSTADLKAYLDQKRNGICLRSRQFCHVWRKRGL